MKRMGHFASLQLRGTGLLLEPCSTDPGGDVHIRNSREERLRGRKTNLQEQEEKIRQTKKRSQVAKAPSYDGRHFSSTADTIGWSPTPCCSSHEAPLSLNNYYGPSEAGIGATIYEALGSHSTSASSPRASAQTVCHLASPWKRLQVDKIGKVPPNVAFLDARRKLEGRTISIRHPSH